MYLELTQVTSVISQMGCCISTNTEAPASALGSKKHLGSDEASSNLKFRHESRAPPPCVEEEAVKEVLSETPKPKPKPIPQPEPVFPAEMKQDLPEEEEAKKETKISDHKVEAFPKIQEKQNLSSNEEIMSEVSEICSVSVSISESVSTMTNVTDKRDNEEEEKEARQRQRVISRSPAKPPPRNGLKRDRVVNQSPTRRSERSPGRRIGNGSVRSVQNQESGRVRGPGRREPGESSGRRSRSPATTRSSAAMGRSPSARRTNKSPGRVRSGLIENTDGTSHNGSRKMEGRRATDNDDADNNNNNNCSTNESLENPLVSLECFIFL